MSPGQWVRSSQLDCLPRPSAEIHGKESHMLKFLASTVGIIFLIGLAVVIGLLMLIF
ncbi:hypothetical protein [Billgrantia lactosivorans]|uniref:hypothetical protein n=1 Tax=Billgrantia lactosivorans TaxID=2185141 RepID=UPI0013A70B73|nr:hypothetical protein [Halomonas lactosivorans]